MQQTILPLKEAVQNVTNQVSAVLNLLSDEQYCKPSNCLFNATIGEHVRHIIELFIELDKGYLSGTVNYENRKRDHRIETDKRFAILLLENILAAVEKNDKTLLLEAGFSGNDAGMVQMTTNYYRELAYNIEHSIHHMALIRVGLNDISAIPVEESFGIAPATIKYRKACVQ